MSPVPSRRQHPARHIGESLTRRPRRGRVARRSSRLDRGAPRPRGRSRAVDRMAGRRDRGLHRRVRPQRRPAFRDRPGARLRGRAGFRRRTAVHRAAVQLRRLTALQDVVRPRVHRPADEPDRHRSAGKAGDARHSSRRQLCARHAQGGLGPLDRLGCSACSPTSGDSTCASCTAPSPSWASTPRWTPSPTTLRH